MFDKGRAASEDGYSKLEDGLWIRPSTREAFRDVDGLILDIDGVVLDVRGSFRVAIADTIQFLFEKTLKFSGTTQLVEPAETQLFKLAGGFNNDWDLTAAIALFFLSKARRLATRSTSVLRREQPSLESFAAEVKKAGGGLQMARRLALSSAGDSDVLAAWEPETIRRIFMEIYAGKDYCGRLYGFEPKYVSGRGLINAERVLVDGDFVRTFAPKVGILTGRTKEETEVALQMARLAELIPMSNVVYDDGTLRKPDPRTLIVLKERLGAHDIFYLGDTPDDVETVVRARRFDDAFLAGVVAPGPKDLDSYFALGADMVTLNANTALKWIDNAREEG